MLQINSTTTIQSVLNSLQLGRTGTGMHTITQKLKCLWWSPLQQLKLAYFSKAVNRVLLWKQPDYIRKCFACWIEGDKSSNHHQLRNTCFHWALIYELHHLGTSFLILNHTLQTDSIPYYSLKQALAGWIGPSQKGTQSPGLLCLVTDCTWQEKLNIHLSFPLLKLAESKCVNIYKNKRWLWRPSGQGLTRHKPTES